MVCSDIVFVTGEGDSESIIKCNAGDATVALGLVMDALTCMDGLSYCL